MGRDVVWVFQQGLPDDRKAKDLVAVQFTETGQVSLPVRPRGADKGNVPFSRSFIWAAPEVWLRFWVSLSASII